MTIVRVVWVPAHHCCCVGNRVGFLAQKKRMQTFHSFDETQRHEEQVIMAPSSESKEIPRRVTWADGTAEAPSARLAVSIPRHKTNQVRCFFMKFVITQLLYLDNKTYLIHSRGLKLFFCRRQSNFCQ
jgi:hypothetical protein